MTCSDANRTLLLAGALAAVFLAAVFLAGCARTVAPRIEVVEPREVPLTGPLKGIEAEISGMSWHADTLIFLPQYPDKFGTSGDLAFFGVPGDHIAALLDDRRRDPLDPFVIPCEAPWLAGMIEGYDGLESMGILADRCYMTVEAKGDTTSSSFLVAGRWVWRGEVLQMDLERLTSIPVEIALPNVSVETIVMDGERIITIAEANGLNVNPTPRAHVFDAELNALGTMPLPQIEYRVTDATALDDQRRFWVLNYAYPPEWAVLRPAPDPEVARWGGPDWLAADVCIERLLELRITDDDHIVRTDTPPLWLQPRADGFCRNWEAVVRFGDRGFLLMTDEHPATMLAFVPLPERLNQSRGE